MKNNKTARWFWSVLGVLNLVVVAYPVILVRSAHSVEDNLFAVFLLMFVMFLLVLVDMVSIVMAEVIGVVRPDDKRTVTRY